MKVRGFRQRHAEQVVFGAEHHILAGLRVEVCDPGLLPLDVGEVILHMLLPGVVEVLHPLNARPAGELGERADSLIAVLCHEPLPLVFAVFPVLREFRNPGNRLHALIPLAQDHVSPVRKIPDVPLILALDFTVPPVEELLRRARPVPAPVESQQQPLGGGAHSGFRLPGVGRLLLLEAEIDVERLRLGRRRDGERIIVVELERNRIAGVVEHPHAVFRQHRQHLTAHVHAGRFCREFRLYAQPVLRLGNQPLLFRRRGRGGFAGAGASGGRCRQKGAAGGGDEDEFTAHYFFSRSSLNARSIRNGGAVSTTGLPASTLIRP